MNKTITTPVGEGIFPHLTKPNFHFDEGGVYSVKLRLSDVQANILKDSILAEVKAEMESIVSSKKIDLAKFPPSLPWSPAVDKEKNPLPGFTDFNIKQSKECGSGEKSWTFTPRLFNADNTPFDTTKNIWTGSKLKVAFRPSVWYVAPRLGITLRLVGAQVLELVSGGDDPESLGFTAVASDGPAPEGMSDLSPESAEFYSKLKSLQKN